MLNLGLGEILIFSVLALVVVGPERLPTMVRFMGRQYGKLMRASRELRRAFYMEAERVESTERREQLKKKREEAIKKQQERIKQHQENPEEPLQGISQDIELTPSNSPQAEEEKKDHEEASHEQLPETEKAAFTSADDVDSSEYVPFDHISEEKGEDHG